ncbi:MAG: hypothetical protein FWD68_20475 [Alphaproteobacteria bacterium]|nr:hypothetical protein [Alphaproteobacteria bacterium]
MANRIPDAKPGLVFRYDYLWSGDAAAGHQQGKDRPACLVFAAEPSLSPRFVVILPITHTQPSDDVAAIEIPPRVKAALGLAHDRSWIIASDFNVDCWPNSGLSPIPNRSGTFSYGFLPPGLFRKVKDAFSTTHRAKRARGVPRQE